MQPKFPGCDCENCPLKGESFVPPSGPEDARILIFAQAPAQYEVRFGRPFSGPSGILLDGALKTAGLRRDDVRVSNSTLCYWKAGSGDPPSEVINACKGHLASLIDKAEVVVPIGSASLESLMGREHPSITSVANTLFSYNGKKVLPLLHPAYYLRREGQSEAFTDFVEGIFLLKDALDYGVVPSEEDVEVIVFDDEGDTIKFLNHLRDNPVETLSVDLETDQPDPVRGTITCVSLAFDTKRAFIIPWDSEYLESHGSTYKPLLECEEVFVALKECLEAQSGVAMHNAPFDAVLLRREGIDVKVRDDTLLMHYALDERTRVQSLKYVCRLLFGIPDWEGELKKYLPKKADPFTLVPPYVLFPYAGRDACYTVRLRDKLRYRLDLPENEGPKRLYDRLLGPCNNYIIDLGVRGAAMDANTIVRALKEMPQRLFELEKEMEQITEDRFFNPRSPQQIAHVLFDKFKLPQVSGRSTKASVLESLKELHVFPTRLIEYRQYAKVCDTYMVNLARGYVNGRGYPDIRLFGTVTGRLSGNKFNPLVYPRESRGDLYKTVKNTFVADEGCFLWASDYKGSELRAMAVLSGDPWLLEQLADPTIDFHSLMAQQIFGERYLRADAEEKKELRVIAKMFVFGLSYGREAPSIARQLGCSIREAQGMINRYFAPMPVLVQWRKDMQSIAIDEEYLENPFGRRRRFPLITSSNIIDIRKQAINNPPQSTSNDVNLFALERVFRTMSPKVRPLWPIHDSILMNVSRDCTVVDLKELEGILTETPQEVLNTDLPFFIDIDVGFRWGDLQHVASVEEVLGVINSLEEGVKV